jgi:predicted HD phosphohydrolase
MNAESITPGATLPRARFKSFDESTPQDWAAIVPQLKVSQAMVPDRVLLHLEWLASDHGGFPVSRLEHSLQTATRAEEDGRDMEYVVCALVHDIGDTLAPYNHPSIAAGIVQPFVSPANHWMVEHHGTFQGYYFFHHIGGDRNARELFRGHEHFEYTEEFCAKYDQTAFDADYVSAPLSHFAPMVHQVLGGPGAVESPTPHS